MAVDSWVEGLSGLAVPVSDGEQVIASLAISGPSSRWNPEAMQRKLDVVLEGSRAATQRLSGRTVDFDSSGQPQIGTSAGPAT
jgi:DNA-binding IclR family transcriptional regulator